MFTIDFSKYFYYNYFIKTERILFMDNKKIKVRKRVKVEKRIDNVRAYVIWDVFSDIWYYMINSYPNISDSAKEKFEGFIKQMSEDVNHLKCDEYDTPYLVERGYNYIDK